MLRKIISRLSLLAAIVCFAGKEARTAEWRIDRQENGFTVSYRKVVIVDDKLAIDDPRDTYTEEQGVPEDPAAAARLFQQAAEAGMSEAAFNLGIMCFLGRGVPEDPEAARSWYKKAAVKGFVRAMFNVETMCLNGIDGSKDLVAAVRWHRKAAVKDSRHTMPSLESIMRKGKVFRWFQRAAEKDNASVIEEFITQKN